VILSLDINGITGSTSIPMSRPWTRLPRHNGAPAHPTPQPARIQALVWEEHDCLGKDRLQSCQSQADCGRARLQSCHPWMRVVASATEV